MKLLSLGLIVTLLLTGCILAPKYERAPGDLPQEYRFQSLQYLDIRSLIIQLVLCHLLPANLLYALYIF